MAITRTYECPDCEHQFRILHMSRDEEPPRFCPSCGTDMGEDPPQVFKMNIGGSPEGRSIDLTYKQIEESSIARAEEAGDPSLKITDLKDSLREGDVAAKIPNNPVTQYMAQTGHSAWQGGSAAATLQGMKPARGEGGQVALEAIQKSRMGMLR